IETAVEAMKRGAFDYLTKPIDNALLLQTLEKALNTRSSREADGAGPSTGSAQAASEATFLGRSVAVRALLEQVRRAAAVDSTVLLVGETGSGKELIARLLHESGPRAAGPFQAINCAALPAGLIESELFGYEKGAFTGAVAAKPGRLELAEGGTVFLDEIGEMPLELQPKLLRALEERTFERVGGVKTRSVDARVVAATNRELREMVAEGLFRDDLYYRLHVITLRLAPLRERKEDIPLLAEAFCARLAARFGRGAPRLSPEAAEALLRHDWPGNVRELQNLLERLMVLEPEDTITADAVARQLDAAIRPLASASSLLKDQVGATSDALEAQMIRRALDEHAGNRTRAAARLGVSRRTLQLKMKKLGLQDRQA
ncbi:MAG: sigma-54 dependent transcriptional regulator, partial [Candidatus Sumerlaeota bacterium]|nr:sigma-54 dependent transcriptional regulator [Candidatus Sumerlaeota bacterium]